MVFLLYCEYRNQTQGGCGTQNLWDRGMKRGEIDKEIQKSKKKTFEFVAKYWGIHKGKFQVAVKEWSGGNCMLNNFHPELGGIQVLTSKCGKSSQTPKIFSRTTARIVPLPWDKGYSAPPKS